MKKITYTNGQPIFSKAQLDWQSYCVESTIKEYISDLITPGVIKGSGGNGGAPFVFTASSLPNKFNVGHGIAISPGGAYPVGNIVSSDYNISERIIIKENTQYDRNNIAINKSSGNTGIDLNYSTSSVVVNYVWIRYFLTTDMSYSVESKLNHGEVIYPKKGDGYDIYVTTTNTPPTSIDVGNNWLLLGTISVPPGGGMVNESWIDQSDIIYAKLRLQADNSNVTVNSLDIHENGISDPTGQFSSALTPSIDPSGIRVLFKQLVSYGQYGEESIHISGYRATSVYPEMSIGGNLYGVVSFSSTDPSGTYYLYAKLNRDSSIVSLEKNTSLPSNDYLLLATVYWNGISLYNLVSKLDEAKYLIGNNNIKKYAITNDKIAIGTIQSDRIGDSQVDTVNIKNGAVTLDKLASNSVDTNKIVNASIIGSKISSSSINDNHIIDRSISRKKINFSIPETIKACISGNLIYSVGINLVKFLVTKPGVISKVFVYLDNCSTSGNLSLDIKKNYTTSIFSPSEIFSAGAAGAGGTIGCWSTDTNGTIIVNGTVFASGRLSSTNNILIPGDIITVSIPSGGFSEDTGNDLIVNIIIDDIGPDSYLYPNYFNSL